MEPTEAAAPALDAAAASSVSTDAVMTEAPEAAPAPSSPTTTTTTTTCNTDCGTDCTFIAPLVADHAPAAELPPPALPTAAVVLDAMLEWIADRRAPPEECHGGLRVVGLVAQKKGLLVHAAGPAAADDDAARGVAPWALKSGSVLVDVVCAAVHEDSLLAESATAHAEELGLAAMDASLRRAPALGFRGVPHEDVLGIDSCKASAFAVPRHPPLVPVAWTVQRLPSEGAPCALEPQLPCMARDAPEDLVAACDACQARAAAAAAAQRRERAKHAKGKKGHHPASGEPPSSSAPCPQCAADTAALQAAARASAAARAALPPVRPPRAVVADMQHAYFGATDHLNEVAVSRIVWQALHDRHRLLLHHGGDGSGTSPRAVDASAHVCRTVGSWIHEGTGSTFMLQQRAGTQLGDALESGSLSVAQLGSVIAQVYATLVLAQAACAAKHNDLHMGNVLVDLQSEWVTQTRGAWPGNAAESQWEYELPPPPRPSNGGGAAAGGVAATAPSRWRVAHGGVAARIIDWGYGAATVRVGASSARVGLLDLEVYNNCADNDGIGVMTPDADPLFDFVTFLGNAQLQLRYTEDKAQAREVSPTALQRDVEMLRVVRRCLGAVRAVFGSKAARVTSDGRPEHRLPPPTDGTRAPRLEDLQGALADALQPWVQLTVG